MALGRFLRENRAFGLQQGLVGPPLGISRDRPTCCAQRGGFRPGREIPHTGQHSLRPLFYGGNSPIPVPPRVMQNRRLHGATESLLDLQQQRSRRKTRQDARNGKKSPVARRARSPHRPETNGRLSHARIFRSSESLARRAKQEKRRERRLVDDAEMVVVAELRIVMV